MRFTKKRDYRNKLRPGAKSLWFLLAFFIFIQVIFSVQQGALGAEFSDLENRSHVISEETKKLEDELIKSTSLLSLSEKAEALGYVKASNTFYIKIGDPFAQVIR